MKTFHAKKFVVVGHYDVKPGIKTNILFPVSCTIRESQTADVYTMSKNKNTSANIKYPYYGGVLLLW